MMAIIMLMISDPEGMEAVIVAMVTEVCVCVCIPFLISHSFPHSFEPTPSPAKTQAPDKPDGEFLLPLMHKRSPSSIKSN